MVLLGWLCDLVDINLGGSSMDCTDAAVQNDFMARLISGFWLALHMGIECTILSRANARHPYRSTANPYGLHTLNPRQLVRCLQGNVLAMFSFKVAMECVRRGIIFTL